MNVNSRGMQTDRQTGRQTDRQTDGQTDGQTGKQEDRQTSKWTTRKLLSQMKVRVYEMDIKYLYSFVIFSLFLLGVSFANKALVNL